MSTMNYGLAEVYVMKKLHKEKMSKMESATKRDGIHTKEDAVDCKEKHVDTGCFPMVFKKIHPNSNSSSSQ